MKTVIEMAREAGLFTHKEVQPELERLVEIARADAIADEREECAVIAETAADCLQNSTFEGVANAIRARGNT